MPRQATTASHMRCLLFAFAISFSSVASTAELAVGKAMPPIQVKVIDSTTLFQVGGKPGKVTIINFWATWCAPCRAEMPAIQTYYEKYKSKGLEVIAISMDDAKDLEMVRKISQSYTFSIASKFDCDYKNLGRIWRMPSTFIVDKNGILQKNGHIGQPTIDLELLETIVTPLLEKD